MASTSKTRMEAVSYTHLDVYKRQVVALDDAVALIAFSICAALAQNMEGGSLDWSVLILPVIFNLVAIAMGSLSGFILNI